MSNIQKRRLENGYTQDQLATILGVERSTVAKWETGQSMPRTELLVKLADMISMMKADMPEQLLKPVVGHGVNMDTFATYGHEVDGDLQRAAGIIDEVYDKIIG